MWKKSPSKREILRQLADMDRQILRKNEINEETFLMLGNLLSSCGYKQSGDSLVVTALKLQIKREEKESHT